MDEESDRRHDNNNNNNNNNNKVNRNHTFALKDHWSGATVGVGADVRFYLRIVVTLLLLWRVALSIILLVEGRYNMTMYTYWSHTLLVVFYILLWISLWTEGWLLSFVALFVFPIALGSTFVVAVSIIIIIQENADVFTAGTSTGLSLSLIHTGDWILHSLPVIEILLIMVVGWLFYARAIIASELAALEKTELKAVYVLYFFLCPLVLLLIYTLIFNPAIYYPTGIPTYILWLGIVAIDLIYMALMYFTFVSSANVGISIYSFFMPSHPTPLPPTVPPQRFPSETAPNTFNMNSARKRIDAVIKRDNNVAVSGTTDSILPNTVYTVTPVNGQYRVLQL